MIELLLANNPVRKFALDTSKQLMILKNYANVASPDALIALKIIASSDKNRNKDDFLDAIALARKNKIDFTTIAKYLNKEQLKLLKKLNQHGG